MCVDSEVMTSPVVCVRMRETLDNIKHIIGTLALIHNGYPVVEDTLNSDSKVSYGWLFRVHYRGRGVGDNVVCNKRRVRVQTIPLTGQLRGFIQLPQLKQLVAERTQLNEANKDKV